MFLDDLVRIGFNILIAISIFFIGKYFAKIITDKIVTFLSVSNDINETLLRFLSSAIYGILLVVIGIVALSEAGVETTSFIAIIGALGLAIGLSFKDSLSHISAGVMIALFQPIRLDEFVEVSGVSGTVEDINIFNTILKTGDNKTIIIGNGKIITGNIINYSRKDTRRVDFNFSIGYEDDLKIAKNIILEILQKDNRVLCEPAEPFVAVQELGDNSVNLIARAWVKKDDYWKVNFETIENVKLSFEQNNITIPYPQLDIHTKSTKEV